MTPRGGQYNEGHYAFGSWLSQITEQQKAIRHIHMQTCKQYGTKEVYSKIDSCPWLLARTMQRSQMIGAGIYMLLCVLNIATV